MSGLTERLNRWLQGSPSSSQHQPVSEVEQELKRIIESRIKNREESDRVQKKNAQEQETERQAKILENHRRCLIISQEASLSNLLEGSRRALLPLYPNAERAEKWTHSGKEEEQILQIFLRWGKEYERGPLKVKSTGRDEGFYKYICFECDGHNDKLALVQASKYSTPLRESPTNPPWVTTVNGITRIDNEYQYHPSRRHFLPEEWRDTQTLTKAIIEAVKNPVLVSWSNYDSGSG